MIRGYRIGSVTTEEISRLPHVVSYHLLWVLKKLVHWSVLIFLCTKLEYKYKTYLQLLCAILLAEQILFIKWYVCVRKECFAYEVQTSLYKELFADRLLRPFS